MVMCHVEINKNIVAEFPGNKATKGCIHLSNPISLIPFSTDLESGSPEFQLEFSHSLAMILDILLNISELLFSQV